MKGFMKRRLAFLTISIFTVGIMLASMIPGINTTLASTNTTPEYLLQWGTLGSGDRQFDNPVGITADSNGYIYVVDSRDDDGGNNRIQKFDSNGNLITKWWTSGTSTRQLQSAKGVAVDSSGNVYVSTMSSTGVYHILKFNQSGNFIAKLGDPITGLGHSGSGFTPFNIAVSSDESIYAAYSGVNKIVKFSNSGAFISEWGTSGSGDGQFSAPRGIAVDSNNNVYVADSYNSRVQKFDSGGNFLAKWGTRGNGDGQFTQAYGIYIDSANDVYVTSAGDGNESVQKFSNSGVFISRISNGARGSANGQFSYPEGIAVDGVKNIYVADTNNARIQKFDGKTGSGPVSFWNFNDSDATVAHDTAGSNNGVISGATHSEGALSFNGTSDYVKIPDSSSLNPTSAITVSLWVKPASLTSNGIALSKEQQYRLIAGDITSEKPAARYRTSTNTGGWNGLTGVSNMAPNTWQFVVLTYNGSKWKLYYNGNFDTEQASTGTVYPGGRDNSDLFFGTWAGYNIYYYKGLLDDIKIYDRALSASEISADYNSGRTVPPACSSWTYSAWNACQASGQQTRTINSSSPAGCLGGSPILNQSCTYIPPCTIDSWQCDDWNSCSVNGNQSRSCNKVGSCEGGVASPSITQSCTYVPPTCSSWTYSDWSTCGTDGKQGRSIISSLPSNCTGGSPIVNQSCTYIPPCTEDKWECSSWNACSVDGKQSRSCTKTFDCSTASTPSPITAQTCTPPQEDKKGGGKPSTPQPTPQPAPTNPATPQCTEDKWECGSWNACSPMGIQSRSCKKTFDCPSVESEIPQTSQYCEAPKQQQPPANTPSQISFDQSEIVKSTVKLACFKDQTTLKGVGSGTIISSDGVILTNKHVVEGTIGCRVGFQNSIDDAELEYQEVADIAKMSDDSSIDIALLKIRNPDHRQFVSVDITHSQDYKFKSAERIYIYGYPVYLTSTRQSQLTPKQSEGLLTGIYSNMTATHGIYGGNFANLFIKTDAKIEHGNSGGGAYGENGTFIGVPTAGLQGDLETLGLILPNQQINQWLLNSKISVSNLSAMFSPVLASVDMKNLKVDYVDMSNVKVSIYSSISKSQLLPNTQGYMQDSSRPLFQIKNVGSVDGYYVYFGTDITADPAIVGKLISTDDYSPNSIVSDNTYYFIVKGKKGDAVSNAIITEYKYKKIQEKKVIHSTEKNGPSQSLAGRLRGNILLQVESHGEAYYVNPNNEKRYFLGRPADAFQIMRELGLGASHDFVVKYKNGVYPDNVIGKILIDVGDSGKAYYIFPKNKRAYYLGRPADAFKVMRELGLGISNKDLDKIEAK